MQCRLVEDRRSHGILVYAGDEPVGWCQFGPANELPLVARGEYIDPRAAGPRRRLFVDGEERRWRVTCFCTRPDQAQQGVTGVALRAALRSIAKKGGGLVEAFPIVLAKGDPDTDERLARIVEWYRTFSRLIKTHGRFSDEMEEHLRCRVQVTEFVEGLGEVDATYHGRGANVGTVNLFSREGFEAVSLIAKKALLCPPGPASDAHRREEDGHTYKVIPHGCGWSGWSFWRRSDESVRQGCNLVELLLDLRQGGRAVAIRLLGHVDVAEAQATGVAVDDVSHQ